MAKRIRADLLLVERGLFESRAKAQAAIAAGLVTADGVIVRKASEEVSESAQIAATPEHPWVSRGGVKLAAALDHFGIDPKGRVCLDVGASTGGFTEVLLTRGARRVYAVDVGHGQLHPKVRRNPAVTAFDGTDIRQIKSSALVEPPDLIVIDVSFISLKLVLPAASALAAPKADLVILIKPQFEAGRAHLKRGIVRDPEVQEAIRDEIAGVVDSIGWRVTGIMPSPILGGDGNREFLLAANRSS